jgi:TolB-like protein
MKTGARLGPYEILAPIGAGGMSEVYRAHDARLGRNVAVKVLAAALALEPERLRRFEQEARAVAALDNPNILAIHDIGTHSGAPYIVTELLEGESLCDRLRGGALPVRRAVEIAVEIAQGLAAAHEKGIIHRDLKPANVFITKDGHVKILDFGIAKLVTPRNVVEPAQATTVVEATEAGTTLGTVGYMSPEQVRGQSVDHRSDIFAFGCVLYEMLSGQSPFRRDTAADTASAILAEDPPPLSASGRPVAPVLQEIVSRCLEKRAEERFSSAHDLALALRAESGALTTSAVGRRGALGRRWVWAGAAVLVVVAAVAIVYMLKTRGPANTPLAPGVIRSIAVLPLANLSGDPAQEYFSDGMTEQLTATLSQISALKVISRTSAMQFKGAKKPLREIAAALGVEGVIEGSVLRAGDRVRITAQLINAATDAHVWGESYERDLRDILTLQSEVARAVAGEVRAKLTPQEQTRLAGGRPVNPEAYELYLKGWELMHSFNPEEFGKALGYFQRAIDLDPTYAPAHAAVANYYVEGGTRGYQAPHETIPIARAALRRALELDEGLAEAHATLGNLMSWYDWDWSGAEKELQRAIALAPNSAIAIVDYAIYLGTVGRPDAAVTEYELAVERDPLAPNKSYGFGVMLYYARRYDQSIAQLQKALKADPPGVGPIARMVLGCNYAQKHMGREAAAECDKAIESLPEDQVVLTTCGKVYGLTGNHQQALALKARVESLSTRQYVDPFGIALIFDGLGDKDNALEWLERSYTERSPNLWALKQELWTDRLRSHPRFQDLVRRMNFPLSTNP